jgi:hypothetical protein
MIVKKTSLYIESTKVFKSLRNSFNAGGCIHISGTHKKRSRINKVIKIGVNTTPYIICKTV